MDKCIIRNISFIVLLEDEVRHDRASSEENRSLLGEGEEGKGITGAARTAEAARASSTAARQMTTSVGVDGAGAQSLGRLCPLHCSSSGSTGALGGWR
jgi:hypothetical protein